MTNEQEPLRIWTVYRRPQDYPGHYVARLFLNDKPTESIVVAQHYDELAVALLEMGLYKMPRSPEDDPVIVEAWL